MVAGLAATTLSLLLATSLYKTSNCVSLGEEAEGGEAGTAAGAAPPPNTTAQGTGEAGEAGEAGGTFRMERDGGAIRPEGSRTRGIGARERHRCD